jgi:hypothetical protein
MWHGCANDAFCLFFLRFRLNDDLSPFNARIDFGEGQKWSELGFGLVQVIEG